MHLPDENRSHSRDENPIRGRETTPFSRSVKLKKLVAGSDKLHTNENCDRNPRIRSLLSLPVPSETVNGNTNAYLGAHTSFNTDANAGADCDTDTHSNTYTNGDTGEHSIPATASFESDSGII